MFVYGARTKLPICTRIGIIIPWKLEEILEMPRKSVLSSSASEGSCYSSQTYYNTYNVVWVYLTSLSQVHKLFSGNRMNGCKIVDWEQRKRSWPILILLPRGARNTTNIFSQGSRLTENRTRDFSDMKLNRLKRNCGIWWHVLEWWSGKMYKRTVASCFYYFIPMYSFRVLSKITKNFKRFGVRFTG